MLMVQVGKLDETIKYYKEKFGMEQLRYRDVPDVRHCPLADRDHCSQMHHAQTVSAGSLALSLGAACCTACWQCWQAALISVCCYSAQHTLHGRQGMTKLRPA